MIADPHRTAPRCDLLVLICMGIAVASALLSAMVVHQPMPFFDVDPLAIPPAVAPGPASGTALLEAIRASLDGIGPTVSLLLSLLALLASAGVLVGEGLAGRGVSLAAVVLAGAGSIVALLHSSVLPDSSLDNLRIAAAWTGAIWTGLAAWHASRQPAPARLIAGLTLAFIVVLAFKSAAQVWIEHPMTLASYHDQRDAFLSARGWLPDSAAARAYERRLNHNDATGWFGLSNVLASFAGATAAGLAVLWVAARTAPAQQRTPARRWLCWALAPATAIAAGTLVLTHSKGGLVASAVVTIIGVAAVGVAAVVLARKTPMPGSPSRYARLLNSASLGGWIVLALTLATSCGVVLRGLVGQRLSELSLLFRWFYMQAAGRIFSEHPIVGVGPAGFQQAYARAKPPLSPEEVTSPHNIFLDYAATLGLAGLGLGLLVAWMFWSAGRRLTAHTPLAGPPIPTRQRAYFLVLVAAVPVVVSVWLQRGASVLGVFASALSPGDPVPSWALFVSAGLLGLVVCAWIGLAIVVDAALQRAPAGGIALGAAGVVLAIHSQIEMTPIQPASAGLWFLMLGVAAGGADPTRSRLDRRAWPVGPGLGLLLGGWLAFALLPVARWESSLARAARTLEPITREDPTPSSDQLALVGRSALADLKRAHEALGRADLPTSRARVRLATALAQRLWQAEPSQAGELLDQAVSIAQQAVDQHPETASAWALLAGALEARTLLTGRPDPGLIDAWQRAHELNPRAMTPILQLIHWAQRSGDPTRTRDLSRRALELNDQLRLDPLRQLTDAQRTELERLAQNP